MSRYRGLEIAVLQVIRAHHQMTSTSLTAMYPYLNEKNYTFRFFRTFSVFAPKVAMTASAFSRPLKGTNVPWSIRNRS